MPALRTKIENGITTALTPLLEAALGGSGSSTYLRHIGPYNGEFVNARIPNEFRTALGGRVPAVLYYTGDSTYTSIDVKRRQAVHDIELHLMIVSGTYRERHARTQGGIHAGDGDPGIYQIIEDIRTKLFGNDLSLDDVGRLVPVVEQARVLEPDFTVWELTYRVETDARLGAIDAAADEYTEISGDVNNDDDDAIDPVVEITTDIT